MLRMTYTIAILAATFTTLIACSALAQGKGPGVYPAQPQVQTMNATNRQVQINGTTPNASQMAVLNQIESYSGVVLPDGSYWYDAVSGAFGLWGEAAATVLPAGLDLGGPIQSNCSGGGTYVYINSREIHPTELAMLQQSFGYINPGRYFLDASGNVGLEGGPVLANLYAAGQAQGQQGSTAYGYTGTQIGSDRYGLASDGQGGFMFMGSDGTSYYTGQ